MLSLDGVYTSNPQCDSPRNPLAPFFPSIVLYGTSLFVADDFNNAIAAYPANGRNTVKASSRIAGSATGLDAPDCARHYFSFRSSPGPDRLVPVDALPAHCREDSLQ